MLLWVLAVLAALTLLVCLTRVGVRIVLAEGSVTVDVKAGPVRIRVYPGRERKAPRGKKREKAEEKPKKTFPKPAKEDIRDAARTLWPPLKKVLSRTRRSVRLDPLRLSLTLGGQGEPADAAKLYGELHAGMWAVMPLLEGLMDIPDPRLHIDVDFNAEAAVLEGEVGVTARIGSLLRVGLGFGFPALRWLLRYQKKRKAKNETAASSAAQERTE